MKQEWVLRWRGRAFLTIIHAPCDAELQGANPYRLKCVRCHKVAPPGIYKKHQKLFYLGLALK